MANTSKRAKRHVSLKTGVMRIRSLDPIGPDYNINREEELAAYYAQRVPFPTEAEIEDLKARALQHMKDMRIHLPLVVDGLVRQNVGARRGI